MRVLFICLQQYPTVGPISNLLKNILVYGNLNKKFDTHVLTIKNSIYDIDQEYIDGVVIHRFYIPELIGINDFRKRTKKNMFFDSLYYFNKIKYRIFSNLQKSNFLDNYTKKRIVRSIEKLLIKNFDIVIPVVGTFESTNAILFLKEMCKYQGKIIQLQFDPCSTSLCYFHESQSNRLNFEQRMIALFDAIFVLPEQYKEYKSIYPEYIYKIKMMQVPNVSFDALRIINDFNLKSNIIKCVFAGSLYKLQNVRDPYYALALFNRAKNSCLYMLGISENYIPQELHSKNIICLGRKSLDETKTILNSADFLVNLGNSVSNQVPSKIFEYISFGKPIIHIRKLLNDPSMAYLSKYPLCLDLYEGDSIDMNIKKLEAFIRENKGKTVPADYIASTYRECTPEYVANQLYEAILEVTGNKTEHWSNEHNENEVDAENRTVPTPDTSREEQLS